MTFNFQADRFAPVLVLVLGFVAAFGTAGLGI